MAVLTDDELGQAVAARVAELGVDTALLRFAPGQQGVYLVHSDPRGERGFSYARRGSVGSTLSIEDLDDHVLASAGAVAASDICAAISPTARAAVEHASTVARRFVYDPNFRPRLTSLDAARETLDALAPRTWLMTPSHPFETLALLDATTPEAAASALHTRGTELAAVTCGQEGAYLSNATCSQRVPVVPAEVVVDQTGAGDSYLGTLTARLVLGDELPDAARRAAAASSLVVGGRGGTGVVPTLDQMDAILALAGRLR